MIYALRCSRGCRCVGKTLGDKSGGGKPFTQLLLHLANCDGCLEDDDGVGGRGKEHGER